LQQRGGEVKLRQSAATEAHLPAAKALLDQLVERSELLDFLTVPAYEQLS